MNEIEDIRWDISRIELKVRSMKNNNLNDLQELHRLLCETLEEAIKVKEILNTNNHEY